MARLTPVLMMDTLDEIWATAAANGECAACAALMQRHYDRVLGLACRLTGTRAEAQDLALDICAALPARLHHWRAEARFTTWLYRVMVNAARDLRRRQTTRAAAASGWGDWGWDQAMNWL
jgi:RNA polymerase sigma-70 factor (ECF subfamily)